MCSDTDLVVPFAPANQPKIVAELPVLTVGPASGGALAEAMIAAIRDLAKTGGPHSVVVVTGGPDSCNPDAGDLIAQEAARAGIELQTFVVGFMVDEPDAQAIKGMIDETPGGMYLSAPDEDTLRNILEAVQAHIDDPATTPTSRILAAATPQATLNFGHTACDYEYWPLRQSASWLYAGPNGEWSDGVASVIGDDVSATVPLCMKCQA
jgi:hypothetical protein